MKQKVGHGLYSHKINLTKKKKKKYTVFIIEWNKTFYMVITMTNDTINGTQSMTNDEKSGT